MNTDRQNAAGILYVAARRGLVTHIRQGLYKLVPFEMGSVTFKTTTKSSVRVLVPSLISSRMAGDSADLCSLRESLHRLTKRNLAGSVGCTLSRHPPTDPAAHDLGNDRTVIVSDIERSAPRSSKKRE